VRILLPLLVLSSSTLAQQVIVNDAPTVSEIGRYHVVKPAS
jgi:hypothetical protein